MIGACKQVEQVAGASAPRPGSSRAAPVCDPSLIIILPQLLSARRNLKLEILHLRSTSRKQKIIAKNFSVKAK